MAQVKNHATKITGDDMSKKNQTVVEETPVESTALATSEENQALSTSFADVAADGEQYETHFNRDDYAIPFLAVLQSNSPQVQEGGPEFIEGARPGMFLNTSNKQTLGKELILAPVDYKKVFVEWVTREAGGGFVAIHTYSAGKALLASCTKDDKGRMILPSGNQLQETAQYFVLALVDDTPVPMMFSLVSTQLKKSRQWVTMIDAIKVERNGKKIKPPMFYMTYKVVTVFESNEKGNWQGVSISPYKTVEELGTAGEELYNAAKQLRQSVESGAVSAEASAAAASGANGDEAPPF
jgi:hypothetical protein